MGSPSQAQRQTSQAPSHRREGIQATAPRITRNGEHATPVPTAGNYNSNATPRYYTGQAEPAFGERTQRELKWLSAGRNFQPHIHGLTNSMSIYENHQGHRDRHPGVQYLAALSSSHPPNPALHASTYTGAMSLSYDSQNYMADANYPNMSNMMQTAHEQEDMNQQPRYPSPGTSGLPENPYHSQNLESPNTDDIEHMPLPLHDSDPPSPGRSKAIQKPDREVTKGDNGRFVCTWVGCTEDVKEFGRKCEWSKHMDKHDRPYKCLAEGCEKLPGFTYSGGLLRHEREVHHKHGGPRKQLNCPHQTCKRHHGKGFSRQENLNEHLRRVHTDIGVQDAEITEEDEEAKLGQKRKRVLSRGGEEDIREEMKRVKMENEDLRRHSQAQDAQIAEMMRQINELQQQSLHNNLQQHARMPQATMLG